MSHFLLNSFGIRPRLWREWFVNFLNRFVTFLQNFSEHGLSIRFRFK